MHVPSEELLTFAVTDNKQTWMSRTICTHTHTGSPVQPLTPDTHTHANTNYVSNKDNMIEGKQEIASVCTHKRVCVCVCEGRGVCDDGVS